MSRITGFRRFSAAVITGSLIVSMAPQAMALPMPVARDLAATSQVEEVQYRRAARPRVPVKRHGRRGGNGLGAAAVIGALAIGAAAIAASQNQRRERTYYDDPYAAPGYGYSGYGYEPEPEYYQPAPAPVYRRSYAPPQYYQPAPPPARHPRAYQQVDGGSPYAIQHQRVQQRAQPQPHYLPRGVRPLPLPTQRNETDDRTGP